MREAIFLFSLLAVMIFLIPSTAIAADDLPSKEVVELHAQLAKAEERSKALTDYLQLCTKFVATQSANSDFITRSTLTLDRLADNLTGITEQKSLAALLNASTEITTMSVNLKGISEGVTPIAITNSPESLREALALVVTSTAKSGALVKEIESIISLTPEQVAEKLKKDGLLFSPPQMFLPETFDKTNQKITPAELDALLAQHQAVKVDELKDLLKPDERELTAGKVAYLQRACRNLSSELKLLYTCLQDTDKALSAEIAALNYLLRDENTRITLLKRNLATSPVADGATK